VPVRGFMAPIASAAMWTITFIRITAIVVIFQITATDPGKDGTAPPTTSMETRCATDTVTATDTDPDPTHDKVPAVQTVPELAV
jgi:hypothetical protein